MMLILIFVVGLRIWMGRGRDAEIVADKTPRKVYCFPEYKKHTITFNICNFSYSHVHCSMLCNFNKL